MTPREIEMSTYTNPIYNPTTIPYKKLEEDEKPQLLKGLIAPSDTTKRAYIKKRRITGAISCLLCTLAITLTFLGAVLTILGVFGGCFRAEDVNSEEFEQFVNMFRPQEHRRLIYSQRIMPFPKRGYLMPGPAMPPFDGDHKIQQHSMCPLMNLIECNRGSFDGYSLEENQERIDLSLGKAVLSDRLNTSYAVNSARKVYKQCVKDFDGEKQTNLRHFARKLMEIKDYVHRYGDSASLFAELAILTQLEFGVSTFFQIDIGANYLSPDGKRPYVMYFDQKLPTALNAAQMSLVRQAFDQNLNETQYQQAYLNIPRLREMAVDSDDSMSWISFTAAEAQARWPFFNFTTYLTHLNSMQKFSHNVKEFLFVVKSPAYFDKLNAFFLGQTEVENQTKMDLFKMLSIHSVFSEYVKYFGVDEIEDKMSKKYQVGNPLSPYPKPYHLIYTYEGGHSTYEALRFCSKELRTHLPHIASAVFADMTSELTVQQEIQRVEGFIELVRTELIEWVNESEIDQSAKDVLAEKLEKVGVSFTTRESLERESFEEAHKGLELGLIGFNSYDSSVAWLKNFLFKRRLEKLNSEVEALRSSSFSEACAATVDIEYSRLGNWLNVPLTSLFTSPILSSNMDSPQTFIYSNIIWILAREMSKAIDSEGVLYNALGIHKRDEPDLKSLEQLWTDSQTCLEQNFHDTVVDGTSVAVTIRKTSNEMIGFQIAHRVFQKKFEETWTRDSGSRHRSRLGVKRMVTRDFFHTSSPVYCKARDRGASVPLLDKLIDSFVKRHAILGCSSKFMNFKCDVQLVNQQ